MSATVFSQVNYTLATLLQKIEMGEICLPDVQRPFVWPNVWSDMAFLHNPMIGFPAAAW